MRFLVEFPSGGEEAQTVASAPPEPRRVRLPLENGESLSKGEILGGEFRSVTEDVAEEQRQDANHAYFAASEKVNHGLETVAGSTMSSFCKFLVGKADGFFGMDRAAQHVAERVVDVHRGNANNVRTEHGHRGIPDDLVHAIVPSAELDCASRSVSSFSTSR